MRKLSFFLTFALVLSLAYGAFAQHNGIVSIDNVSNTIDNGGVVMLMAGYTHVASIRYNLLANSNAGFWGGSNGWELYSPDGANWVNLLRGDGPIVTALAPATNRYRKYFKSADNGATWAQTATGGSTQPGPSTGAASRVGYYLTTLSGDGTDGFVGGVTNGIAVTLTFQTLAADSNKTMCLDTAAGITAWEWAAPIAGSDFPLWDNGLGVSGPRCFSIYFVPNQPPVFDSPTDNLSFNHCGEGSKQLVAHDPDGDYPLTYSFAPGFETGFGTVTAAGAWTWSGSTVPQAGLADPQFLVTDAKGAVSVVPFTLHVTTTNNAPTIQCPALLTVGIGMCKTQTVTVADVDICDGKTLSFVGFSRPFNGTYSITGTTIELCPISGDENTDTLKMTVQVSDGAATATCDVLWNVIKGSPYQVEIEKVKDQYQGQYTDVFIKLYGVDITQGLGGFDFMVAYDNSALAFQLASEGDIYTECGWEYFTYRFGPRGNCGNGCPSGQLRVIGMAETNDGPNHPGCNIGHVGYANTFPVILANMRFLVSNDRTLNCQFVPIRFYWYDCGDNVLSNYNGSELYLSTQVYDFTEYDNPFLGGAMGNTASGFPTYTGAQADCFYENVQLHKVAKQNVDFQNGGVDIICSNLIDAPGDVNINGIAYEIADAVMFTNYFITGLSAFGTHIEGSIAATDANQDGITLSVADLVYLIRVVVGDAQPYAKLSPMAARITVGDGVFNVNQAMGAAYVVMAGNVTPTLLAGNMEMQYGFNGQNTNIIVWSREGNSFNGDFLRANGEVIKTEFAAANGAPVIADVMPANYELHQNYPNPFNPSTTIKIDVPNKGADWKLNIYNVTGQLVQSFSGVATGFDAVTWDASNVSSGVYFYKLTSGDYSATKKAVLLK